MVVKYPEPLLPGVLIKRYKRFLADIRLDSGEEITAHCANTGSMKHCATPGSRVWVLNSHNPKRKLPYGWEWVEIAGEFKACINTARANDLVYEALMDGAIAEIKGSYIIQREPKVEDGRLDFFLQSTNDQPSIYIEVKTVTLLDDLINKSGVGSFPDAITTRGLKHLERLLTLNKAGYRSVLIFCVAHEGINVVRAAHEIDRFYAEALSRVCAAGVEVLAYQVRFDELEYTMRLTKPLRVAIN